MRKPISIPRSLAPALLVLPLAATAAGAELPTVSWQDPVPDPVRVLVVEPAPQGEDLARIRGRRVEMPGGSILFPNGNLVSPEGMLMSGKEGRLILRGALLKPDGTTLLVPDDVPEGTVILSNGSILFPDGSVLLPSGTIVMPVAVVEAPPEAVAAPVQQPIIIEIEEQEPVEGFTEPAVVEVEEVAVEEPVEDHGHDHSKLDLKWGVIQDTDCWPRECLSARPGSGDEWYENMELGITLDFISEISEVDPAALGGATREAFDRYNRVRPRSMQLHMAAAIDWAAWAYAAIDVSDGGEDQSEFFLREAAIWLDALPSGLALRAGKYYADLGSSNRYYVNELASPNMDGVRRDFLGGNLALTGAELHQRFEYPESALRWSVGVAGDSESHDVDSINNGIDVFPDTIVRTRRRGADNWAATARVEWDGHLGRGWGLRLGGSGYYTPRQPVFTLAPGADGVIGSADDTTTRTDERQAVGIADVTLTWAHDEHSFDALTLEFLWNNAEFVAPTATGIDGEDSIGAWARYRHAFDEHWSLGALTSVWQLSGARKVNGITASGINLSETQGSFHEAWAAYHFSPRNRIQVFLSHTNPGGLTEKFFAVGAQWTLTFGAPRRGSQLRWLEADSVVPGERVTAPADESPSIH